MKTFTIFDRMKFADRPDSARLGPHIQCPGQDFLVTGDRMDPKKLDIEIANAIRLNCPWTINIERLRSPDGGQFACRPTFGKPGSRFANVNAVQWNARASDAIAYIRGRVAIDLGFYFAPYDPSDFASLGMIQAQTADPNIPGRMSDLWLAGAMKVAWVKCQTQIKFFNLFAATWSMLDHVGARCYVDRLTKDSLPAYTQATTMAICDAFSMLDTNAGQSPPVLAYVDVCELATGTVLPADHLRAMVRGARKSASGMVFYGGRSNRPFTAEFAAAIDTVKSELASVA
jgi:hypothetical protein